MKKLLLLLGSVILFSACSFPTTTKPTVESSPTPFTSTSPTTNPVEMVKEGIEAAKNSRTIVLKEQNNLGQSGTAVLAEVNEGKVTVTLSMEGGNFTQPQPAHIHVGTCPSPGAVKYPLTNVVNGKSITELNVSLDDLLKSGDKLALNVHKSVAESNVYTACGNLK